MKLSVQVTGTPDPEVEWQKDGKPIRDGRRVKVDKGKDGVYSVTIPRAETADQGDYSCTAKNKAGKALCSAKLTVEGIYTSVQFTCHFPEILRLGASYEQQWISVAISELL